MDTLLIGLCVLAILVSSILGFIVFIGKKSQQNELNSTRRYVALNLMEPLWNSVLIGIMYTQILNRHTATDTVGSITSILVTLPMCVLLIPLAGLNYQDSRCRSMCRWLLGFGLARWASVITIMLIFSDLTNFFTRYSASGIVNSISSILEQLIRASLPLIFFGAPLFLLIGAIATFVQWRHLATSAEWKLIRLIPHSAS